MRVLIDSDVRPWLRILVREYFGHWAVIEQQLNRRRGFLFLSLGQVRTIDEEDSTSQ